MCSIFDGHLQEMTFWQQESTTLEVKIIWSSGLDCCVHLHILKKCCKKICFCAILHLGYHKKFRRKIFLMLDIFVLELTKPVMTVKVL